MTSPRFALAVLTAMNLLNYIDRYVPSAVKDLFKADLHMTDAQTSLPLTAFVLVYMTASPIFGGLADRYSRPKLIAAGVALWSLATAAASFATGFASFLAARALVGVGEAAYATISPGLLSDFYAPDKRNKVLMLFYVALPVGAALGFIIGGYLGQHYGWRAAFLFCGLPGVLAALLCLRIKDPGRGVLDEKSDMTPVGWPEALRTLWKTPLYLNAVFGYTLVTFAAGGMADWFPSFLSRNRGMDLAEAGSVVGTMTVIGGLSGTVLGGLLADRLKTRTRQPYLALSGLSMIPASLFAALALIVEGKVAVSACILLAQFFLWFYNGPINAILVNSSAPNMRARAFAMSILCIHLFGDAISPPIIGAISDATGQLICGVSLIPCFMAGGALVWLYGWRKVV